MGFISGLIKLFDNNIQYCLEIKKKTVCYGFAKPNENIYYNKCLITLDNMSLSSKDPSQVITTKFLPSILTCGC